MSIPFPKVPTRLRLPAQLPTDLPSALFYIQQLVDELQNYVNVNSNYANTANGADVLANRPAPGIQGRTYYATDNSHFYVDDGTAWDTLI